MQERIGRYVLQGKIGSGSTGTVYLALEPDLERRVAIKQLAAELASYPEFLPRFRDEARTMARLNHPNCVKVFDFFEEQGNSYLVAEYVDGASLREVLDQAKKLTPRQALGVLKGALLGLVHAHSLGLVHRDIKPENVLCDREGTSKLADFGLTTRNTEQQDASQGSPLYMSPEQVKGGAIDQRSDIYSCGAMLFELLTGRPPFVADSPLAVMHMHATDPVPDPRQVSRRLPAAVAQLVISAMAKDPGDRPQSAEEFLALLEEAAKTAYGVGWETGASIAGLTAAAISAGAAAASASGTGAAVAGTQVVGSAVAGGAAAAAGGGEGAAGGGAATGGTAAPNEGATGGGGLRSVITRLGPARVTVIAVVAIAIVTGGTYGASRWISPSSSPSRTSTPQAADILAKPRLSNVRDAMISYSCTCLGGVHASGTGEVVLRPAFFIRTSIDYPPRPQPNDPGGITECVENADLGYCRKPGDGRGWFAFRQAEDKDRQTWNWSKGEQPGLLGEETLNGDTVWHVTGKWPLGKDPFDLWVREKDGYPVKYRSHFSAASSMTETWTISDFNSGRTISFPASCAPALNEYKLCQ